MVSDLYFTHPGRTAEGAFSLDDTADLGVFKDDVNRRFSVKSGPAKIQLWIRVLPELKTELEKRAQQDNRTSSQLAEMILQDGLKKLSTRKKIVARA